MSALGYVRIRFCLYSIIPSLSLVCIVLNFHRSYIQLKRSSLALSVSYDEYFSAIIQHVNYLK